MSNTFADVAQLRIGMVFSYTNDRINHGRNLKDNLIEVGLIHEHTGTDAANDNTRMDSKYVVEHVKLTTDSPPAITTYDEEEYPRVYARRLNIDGSYNPDGELIVFYAKYGFESFLSIYMTTIHKIMRRIINFVDGEPEQSVLQVEA